jgi:hypothetical protein
MIDRNFPILDHGGCNGVDSRKEEISMFLGPGS